jgi:2,3-bisphosphoglycerate-independent phosphoglycerate mutase
MVFLDETGKGWPISQNDGVFFFNFRPDRARQLSKKILEKKQTHNLCFVTLTQYDEAFETLVAFPQNKIDTSLAGEISRAGLTQSHIAETEKYAHVTYFFNGGKEQSHKNEHFFLIESRRDIPTHDLVPEMRAKEIADKAIERLEAGDGFLVMNFANADMVGHTANVSAIITAVETVDTQLRKVVDKVLMMNGIALITADHGNAELNINEKTGEKHTAHTTNLVPCILITSNTLPLPLGEGRGEGLLRSGGTLADIAPTILKLLNLKIPAKMTGKSLIEK